MPSSPGRRGAASAPESPRRWPPSRSGVAPARIDGCAGALALAAARRRRTGRRHPPAAARPRGHRPRRRHHRSQAGLPTPPARRRSPDQRGRCQHRPAPAAATSASTSARSTRVSATSRRQHLGVSTCGMLIRLADWQALDGLDPDVPCFRDGVELGWRATARGLRVVTTPRAEMVHRQVGRAGLRPRGAGGKHPDRVDQQLGLLLIAGHAPTWRLPFTWLRLAAGLPAPGLRLPARQGSAALTRRAGHPRLAVRPSPTDPGLPAPAQSKAAEPSTGRAALIAACDRPGGRVCGWRSSR